ncbi:hypothetical protein KC347_g286 [Hortaea werneckii]|nr:hypothetical protein KC347_g286 [Hortaea werneckii]
MNGGTQSLESGKRETKSKALNPYYPLLRPSDHSSKTRRQTPLIALTSFPPIAAPQSYKYSPAYNLLFKADASLLLNNVALSGAVEHVFVDLQERNEIRAIQLPVREIPRIHQPHGVRPDLLEQLHHGARAGELDLSDRDSGRGVELARLLLERVKRVQAEELVHDVHRLGAELAGRGGRACRRGCGGEGFVEVLHDHVLAVGAREAVERFEGEEGAAPGEGGDNVFVLVEDVEGGAGVLAFEEGAEDVGGFVGGGVDALED